MTEEEFRNQKNIKASNPKDAVGSRKVGLSRVSMPVMMELDAAMFEGALKYGRHNYRAIGVRYSVYYDAVMRHMGAWWEGQDTDPDSGLHHLTKAMACLAVVRDAMLQGKVEDDRPPISDPNFIPDLNKRISALIDKYPEPKDPWTQQKTEIRRDRVGLANEGLAYSSPTSFAAEAHREAHGSTSNDRRVGLADRRVNKNFDSSHPTRRKKQLVVLETCGDMRWGRRATDPIAY